MPERASPLAPARLVLSAGLLLALAAPAGSNLAWGLSSGARWPVALRLALGLAGLLAIWWPVQAAPSSDTASGGGDPVRGGRPPTRPPPGGPPASHWLLPLLLVAAGLALFLALDARTLLFGDGFEIVRRIEGGLPATPRSSLYNLLGALFHRPGDGTPPLQDALQAVSLAAGLLFLLVLAWQRRRLGLVPGALLVMTGGYLGLFAGYLESYALFAPPLVAWGAALSLPAAPRRTLLLVLLNAAAILAHALGFLLVPFTLWQALGGRARAWPVLAALGALVAAGLLLGSRLPAAFRYLDPRQALEHFGAEWSALTPRPWTGGVGSLSHWLEVMNGLFLAAGPALVTALALALFPAGRRALAAAFRAPLGLAALAFVGARLLVATPLGPLLDWDLLSLFWIPAAMVTAQAWSRLPANDRRRLLPGTAAVALVLTLPWLVTLHGEGASTLRVEGYRDGRPRPPGSVRGHIEHALAEQWLRRGDNGAAAEAFGRAYEAYPRDLYARRAAVGWQALGRDDRALMEFERALAANPADRISREGRGNILLRSGNREAAGAEFQRLLELDPPNIYAHFGLAVIAQEEGRDDLARPHYEAAASGVRLILAGGQSGVTLWRMLSDALLALGRTTEAIPVLETLLAAEPADPITWYNLGLAHLTTGNPTAAAAALRRSATLWPENGEVRRLLDEAVAMAERDGRGGDGPDPAERISGSAGAPVGGVPP